MKSYNNPMKHRRLTGAFALGAILLSVLWTKPSAAQAARSERSSEYWGTHLGITGGGLLLTGAALLIPVPAQGGLTGFAPLDRHQAGTYTPLADSLSDATAFLSIGALPASILFGGTTNDTWNGALVYGESMSLSIFINQVVKRFAARPRPYTYAPDPGKTDFRCEADSERCVSFYSAHSSNAFAAAWSSLLLLSEGSAPRGYKYTMWGAEMALATATAHLRIRAGKHFLSDVLLGVLVGSAIGIGVPMIHGGTSFKAPSGEELGFGLCGAAVGLTLPFLVSTGTAGPAQHFAFTPIPVGGDGAGIAILGVW